MDNKFMLELLISIAIFAPGIVLLTGCLFVGAAMMIEKIAPAKEKKEMPTETNPKPGPIVGALKESIAQKDASRKSKVKY